MIFLESLINSEQDEKKLVLLSAGLIVMVAYFGKHCILDLLLFDALLILCRSGCVILIQWLLRVLTQTIKLLTINEMFCSCFLVSF